MLATGGSDRMVRLWDGQDHAPIGEPLGGHAGEVLWGAWAEVGGRPVLATGGSDRMVRLWDGQDHAPIGEPLGGHAGEVLWGAWAEVGGRPVLATGGSDGWSGCGTARTTRRSENRWAGMRARCCGGRGLRSEAGRSWRPVAETVQCACGRWPKPVPRHDCRLTGLM